jgi:hypothetical protein
LQQVIPRDVIDDGSLLLDFNSEPHTELFEMDVHPIDRKRFLTCGQDGTVRLFDRWGQERGGPPLPSTPPQSMLPPGRLFAPSASSPLDGIIAYLTWRCGGNVDDHGIVKVTSSRPFSDLPHDAAKNVVDLTKPSYSYSSRGSASDAIPHVPNNWICLDFRYLVVLPTHYSISTFAAVDKPVHPKSWTVEGSIDGSTWAELDRHENSADLNRRGIVRIFRTSASPECRFVRLVNVGRNHRGDDTLADRSPGVQFALAGEPLDGIIAQLTQQCGGNVHDNNVVVVTSSPPFSGHRRDAAKNVVDLRSGSYFCSVHRGKQSDVPHTRNNWVCYEFKGSRVLPTHYSIRTGYKAFMKSWLVEVSDNGNNWHLIDRQENCREANAAHYVGVFGVSE